MPFLKFPIMNTQEETFRVWKRNLEYLFSKNLNDDNIATTSLTLGADQVKESNIDWGLGADQVDAGDIPITDASSFFNGGTVETALTESGYAVTTLTTNASIGNVNKGYVLCNSTGAFTVTLPAISSSKTWYSIRNINSGTITINPVSTDLIDDSTSFDLYQDESLHIVDSGLQWREG